MGVEKDESKISENEQDRNDSVAEFLRDIRRPINCLSEENRNIRRKALEEIRSELPKCCLSPENLQIVIGDHLLNVLLKLLSDQVEKCRELSLLTLKEALQRVPAPEFYLNQIMPILTKRLGQQDVVEPSEEMRLQLIHFLKLLVTRCKKKIAPFLDDIIKVLQQTITDSYPEVKKCSCECAVDVAQTIPEHFHMQCESLVKPLLKSLTHQHSKVRVVVVRSIGVVLQHGNGKLVDDVVSHLAQRLFDSAPLVRLEVIKTVGGWLLNLPDRYSYHHKLIPLLLTGVVDENKDVQDEACCLWLDVGLKYESENEKDLKDKMDFVKPAPQYYPKFIQRPNLGCRQLVYHNYSKILPAILRELADWDASTRIKAAQLLYILLINEEDNVTQHLDNTLAGLYKASTDEEPVVVEFVLKSAELLGYFVNVDIWGKMVLQNIRLSQHHGSVFILGNIIKGSQQDQLQLHLNELFQVLSDPGICQVAENKIQEAILVCVDSVMNVMGDDCQSVVYQLLHVLLFVVALQRKEEVASKAKVLIARLASIESLEKSEELIDKYMKQFIDFLIPQCDNWLHQSAELCLFETILHSTQGESMESYCGEMFEIFFLNLKTSKSVEVRHRFFALLSHLVNLAPVIFKSESNWTVYVIKEMIIPNCIWSVGRTAEVIRKSAVSCLWMFFNSHLITKNQLQSLVNDGFVNLLKSLLEDENKGTRLTTCYLLAEIFNVIGDSLEKNADLYNFYPALMGRLDDGNDDVRIAASLAFSEYLSCLRPNFSVELYSGHLEEIFKGLLIHLDDPKQKIQESILETLERNACLNPDMLLKLTTSVKFKHRSSEYCDALIQHIHALPKHS